MYKYNGYDGSRYYDLLDNLTEKGEQNTNDGRKALMDQLRDELINGDGWIADHFNSAAEYLLDSVYDDDDDLDFDEIKKEAEEEIACFIETGWINIANRMQEMLDEAVNALSL